jgi:hypothetical protein
MTIDRATRLVRAVLLCSPVVGAVGLNAAPRLVTPMEGVAFRDWVIGMYVDHGAGDGLRDYRGGDITYEGHKGTDYVISDFRCMDSGYHVLAAARGKVIAVHDGEYDRNVDGVDVESNYIVIGHEDRWATIYGHLRKGSLLVGLDDEVVAGQPIAQVGSSGQSTFPHLHFEVHHNYEAVDPFMENLWENPPVYTGDVPGVLSAGLSSRVNYSRREFIEGGGKEICFLPGAQLMHWVDCFGVKPGDRLEWKIISSDGESYAAFSDILNHRFGFRLCRTHRISTQAGTRWCALFSVNGVILSSIDFYVTSRQDADQDTVFDDLEREPLRVGIDDSVIDSDGDGLTNADEFWWGTDPADAASSGRLDLNIRDGHCSLTFKAPAGRHLSLQQREGWSSEWRPCRYLNPGHVYEMRIPLTNESSFFRLQVGIGESFDSYY